MHGTRRDVFVSIDVSDQKFFQEFTHVDHLG